MAAALLATPARTGETPLSRGARAGAAGLALLAVVVLVPYILGLAGGRLETTASLGFGAALALALVSAFALSPRRSEKAEPLRFAPAGPGDRLTWWDAASGLLLLTALAATIFPYTFEDARVIWGCRAFAFERTGLLSGIGACRCGSYPPLFSLLLWLGVRDPLFQGRLLPWLALVFFALFLRDRIGRVLPEAAPPALLFFLATVHVWQGTATLYADVPLMVFLSAGTLLALGLPRLGADALPPLAEQVAGSLSIAAAVLLRPDGLYYLGVVLAAVLIARGRWRERLPLWPFLPALAAAASWGLRPDPLRTAGTGVFQGFLGHGSGAWAQVAATPLASAAKVLGVFLFSWQGQWLSHKGLGLAVWLLAVLAALAVRRRLLVRAAPPGDLRFLGLVTLGSLGAVALCFAVFPFVADPVAAVQPYDGDYLACYRNLVRVGLGRMTVHLYPYAVLFAVSVVARLGGESSVPPLSGRRG